MSKAEVPKAKATGRKLTAGLVHFEVLCPDCEQAQYVVSGKTDCIRCGTVFQFSPFPANVPEAT